VEKEKDLYHAPDSDASGPKEPLTKEFYELPPQLNFDGT